MVEDLEKNLGDPENLAIPWASVAKVEVGRAPLLFGPYLRVQYQI
jgi:hypothetical protein